MKNHLTLNPTSVQDDDAYDWDEMLASGLPPMAAHDLPDAED